jgi:hypothetical protein
MDGVVKVLQAAAAVATILLCGFVIYAVWRLRSVVETLDDSGKKLLENLAALTAMAREREIPLRAADTLGALKDASEATAQGARSLSEASAAVREFFANEKAKAVPLRIHELLSQAEELAADLRKTSEQLRCMIAAPGDAMARFSDNVAPMIADARKKAGLVQTFLEALLTGVSVSWDEMRKPEGDGGGDH